VLVALTEPGRFLERLQPGGDDSPEERMGVSSAAE
jgi:hypothetical protein